MTCKNRGAVRLAATLALVLALWAPAAAHAVGQPFAIDAGKDAEDPHVAVDENGVGHFVWNEGPPAADDVLRYCRVPRNGKVCTASKQFALPKEDFAGPRVLLSDEGRVLLLSNRCCGRGPPPSDRLDVLWLVESPDGGNTWKDPRPIGTGSPSGDAVFGPGDFSVSTISETTTGGVVFQAAPIGEGAYTADTATLGENGSAPSAAYNGRIAFLDPLTPIAAMDDLDSVFYRKWSGNGDYNSLGSWGPLTKVGPGEDTRLAGGKRGVFLSFKTEAYPRQYRVARWTGTGFGPSAELTPKGDPIFSELNQDSGGTVHFLWVDDKRNLQHRVSNDGKTWKAPEQLAPESFPIGIFDPELSAARDAGGFAVWDNNGGGPVRAVGFGPTGPVADLPEDASCVLELKVGAARIAAREGCLKKEGTKYTTTGDVRVNGIDLITGGAKAGAASDGARAAADTKIVVDKDKGTLETTGKVDSKLGNVVLDNSKLSWKLPVKGGQITDPAGNPATFDTGKFDIKVLGLPVSGYTSAKINSDGTVEIPIHLGLPSPLGGVGGLGNITGDIVLKGDLKNGLKLSNLKIHAEHVGLGIAEIEVLDIEYVGDPSKLYGKANLLLPVIRAALETEFQFKAGLFDFGKAALTLPGQGIPVASGVYLKQIAFEVQGKTPEHPTKIGGSVKLVGGPSIGGKAAVGIVGSVSYTFPDAPKPGVFRAEGTGTLVEIPAFNVFVQYETSGKLTFGAGVKLGDSTLGINGKGEGGVDLKTGAFDLYGEANICAAGLCGSAKILISSKAVAGCIGASALGIGAAYVWGEGLEGFLDCDLEEYKALAAARFAQTGTRTFDIRAGQDIAGIQVVGQGAPPRITVTGPQGQTIATPADQSQPVNTVVGVLVADTKRNLTAVNLRKPAGGKWTLTAQPGSSVITSFRQANGIPQPKVTAVVSGKGHRRTVSYTVRTIAGQSVRLAEEGKGAYKLLGVARGARGTIAFRPAGGPAGKRQIIALVEQGGRPRARVVAGSYTAPGPQRPTRPRRVTLSRRSGKLVVSWTRSSGADRYLVRVKLKDGRRLTIPTKRRRLTIGNVPGIDSGSIAVYGMARDGMLSKAGRAILKAKPKKLKKRKRRR